MTLVDDINSAKSGKEFITVVTKNGNYFYIIIDRDDEGNNTVHFLNLVEEEDLLELMSEEEAQTYLDNLETQATEPVDTTPTEPVQDIPEETEPEGNFELNMDNETMIMLAIPIVVLMAGGFAVYFVFSRKKPQKAPAETSGDDDDWDYDYEIPEEEDDAPDEDKY